MSSRIRQKLPKKLAIFKFQNQQHGDLLTCLPFKPANANCNLYQYFETLNN